MNFLKRLQETLKSSPQEIPEFKDTEIVRYHYIFKGIVQNVGFRIEIWKIANKLNLTGWVKNKSDGSVECEIQSEQDRIDYTIKYLKNIPRIYIEIIKYDKIQTKEENTFEMLNY